MTAVVPEVIGRLCVLGFINHRGELLRDMSMAILIASVSRKALLLGCRPYTRVLWDTAFTAPVAVPHRPHDSDWATARRVLPISFVANEHREGFVDWSQCRAYALARWGVVAADPPPMTRVTVPPFVSPARVTA